MELTLSAIPEKEALRYLGVKGDVPPALLEQVQDACRALLPHCRVRYVWRFLDKESLSDLLVAAVNEAIKRVDQTSAAEMQKITGSMNMPGLF